MAFTNVVLQIEDILNTDFIPDAFSKVNANFSEVSGNFEDLVNVLQIDYVNAIIGTTTPIQAISTQNINLKAGSLIYTNSNGTQVGSLTLDSNNLSVLTVNTINSGSAMTTANITASGTISTLNLTANGITNLLGPVSSAASIAQSPQTVVVNLAYNTVNNFSEATITLTNTSSKNVLLVLSADAGTYTGSFNPAIVGVNLTVELDAINPPADGTEFFFTIANFVSGSTSIIAQWAALSKNIALIPAATLAIQDNAPGVLASPIYFSNILFNSNISFVKVTSGAQPRLLIVGEKNMTT